jgi:hypothetical protein
MIKKLIASHPRKIIIGTPIIFLIIVNLTGALTPGNNFFSFTAQSNFIVVGSEVPVTLLLSAKTPINAVGGTITFPPEALNVVSTSRITSIIDLWAEEPSYSNTNGTLHFSGGILGGRGSEGIQGTLIVVNFNVINEGKMTLTLENGQILANDGKGTNVISGSKTLTIYAHKPGAASPDVNRDGVLSVADVDTLYWKTFRSYNAAYDLNGDRKVNWGDVSQLIGLL